MTLNETSQPDNRSLFALLPRASLVLTTILLLIAAYWFSPGHYYTEAVIGWAFFFMALVTSAPMLWSSWSRRKSTEAAPEIPPLEAPRAIRWRLLAVATVMMLVVTQANALDLSTAPISHHLQMLLLVMSIILAAVALGGLHIPAYPVETTPMQLIRQGARWLWQRPDAKALLAITLVALAIRVYNLEYGIHRLVDEINFIDPIIKLWYDPPRPILLPFGGTTSFPWTFPYFQAIFAGIFGAGLSPMRIVSVIFGTLQIPVMYGLMKAAFDRRTGIIAALVLATFPAHVHFSRIGINNIADPLFALMAMMFMIRGMKSGRQFDFAAAGLSLGLTHYFYEGGRLFYTPFFVMWLVWLVVFRVRRTEYRFPSIRNLLIFAAGFLLLALPLYYAWAVNTYSLTPRYDTVGKNPLFWFQSIINAPNPLQGLWNKLEQPFMFYVFFPETGPFYTEGRLLVVVAVPFALLGVITSLWRLRRVGESMLIIWLITAAAAVSFLSGMPQSPRYVVVMPALAAVTAIGISFWCARVSPLLPERPGRWLPYVVAIIVAAAQGAYFLGDFLPNYYYRQFYYEAVDNVPVLDFDDVLFRIVQLPRNTDIYIVSPAIRGGSGFMAFLEYYGRYGSGDLRILTVTPEQFGETYLMSQINYGRNQEFFIEPGNTAAVDMIKSFFPHADGPGQSPFPIPVERQFELYSYPGDEFGKPPRDALKMTTPG